MGNRSDEIQVFSHEYQYLFSVPPPDVEILRLIRKYAADHEKEVSDEADAQRGKQLVTAELIAAIQDWDGAGRGDFSEDQRRTIIRTVTALFLGNHLAADFIQRIEAGETPQMRVPANQAEAIEVQWVGSAGAVWTKHHQEETANRFNHVWTTLREMNIYSVSVDFSGSGDSGEIDSIEPAIEPGGDLIDMVKKFHAKEVVPASEASSVMLVDLIEELSDALCRPEVPDWWNSEGGYGTLEWKLNRDGSSILQVTVHQQVSEYDTTVLTYDASGNNIMAKYVGRSN